MDSGGLRPQEPIRRPPHRPNAIRRPVSPTEPPGTPPEVMAPAPVDSASSPTAVGGGHPELDTEAAWQRVRPVLAAGPQPIAAAHQPGNAPAGGLSALPQQQLRPEVPGMHRHRSSPQQLPFRAPPPPNVSSPQHGVQRQPSVGRRPVWNPGTRHDVPAPLLNADEEEGETSAADSPQVLPSVPAEAHHWPAESPRLPGWLEASDGGFVPQPRPSTEDVPAEAVHRLPRVFSSPPLRRPYDEGSGDDSPADDPDNPPTMLRPDDVPAPQIPPHQSSSGAPTEAKIPRSDSAASSPQFVSSTWSSAPFQDGSSDDSGDVQPSTTGERRPQPDLPTHVLPSVRQNPTSIGSNPSSPASSEEKRHWNSSTNGGEHHSAPAERKKIPEKPRFCTPSQAKPKPDKQGIPSADEHAGPADPASSVESDSGSVAPADRPDKPRRRYQRSSNQPPSPGRASPEPHPADSSSEETAMVSHDRSSSDRDEPSSVPGERKPPASYRQRRTESMPQEGPKTHVYDHRSGSSEDSMSDPAAFSDEQPGNDWPTAITPPRRGKKLRSSPDKQGHGEASWSPTDESSEGDAPSPSPASLSTARPKSRRRKDPRSECATPDDSSAHSLDSPSQRLPGRRKPRPPPTSAPGNDPSSSDDSSDHSEGVDSASNSVSDDYAVPSPTGRTKPRKHRDEPFQRRERRSDSNSARSVDDEPMRQREPPYNPPPRIQSDRPLDDPADECGSSTDDNTDPGAARRPWHSEPRVPGRHSTATRPPSHRHPWTPPGRSDLARPSRPSSSEFPPINIRHGAEPRVPSPQARRRSRPPVTKPATGRRRQPQERPALRQPRQPTSALAASGPSPQPSDSEASADEQFPVRTAPPTNSRWVPDNPERQQLLPASPAAPLPGVVYHGGDEPGWRGLLRLAFKGWQLQAEVRRARGAAAARQPRPWAPAVWRSLRSTASWADLCRLPRAGPRRCGRAG